MAQGNSTHQLSVSFINIIFYVIAKQQQYACHKIKIWSVYYIKKKTTEDIAILTNLETSNNNFAKLCRDGNTTRLQERF